MNKNRNFTASLIVLIFGFFFAGGGAMIFSETALPTWQDWRAMQQWQPASASLLEISGSENETSARYRYQFNGISYYGERVYVASFNDNIGTYHADLLHQLTSQKNAGQKVSVWVNPYDPQQAVIDRDMRWGLFALMCGFCSVFIFIGLVFVVAGILPDKKSSRFKQPSLAQLRAEWDQKIQQEPNFTSSFIEYRDYRVEELKQHTKGKQENIDWHMRKGWETPLIRSQVRSDLFMYWSFAVLFNAVIWPVMFSVLPDELRDGNYMVLFVLLFPLLAIFLLYKAVLSTLQYQRFGKVFFEMDPYPGAIGGHVGGRIRVTQLAYNTASAASSQLSVRLECVYSYMSGSGENRRRKETIKWAEEGLPRTESTAKGVALVFRFDVPDNLPEADIKQKDAYHYWRLTVKAVIQGVDLVRQYDIPVFRTGEESRYIRHDISAQVVEHMAQKSEATKNSIALGDFDLPGLSRSMRTRTQGDDLTLFFPMFRNKALTFFAGVFAGGFGFASYSMIAMAVEQGGWGFMMVLFGLPFFLVALIASMAMIYLLFNNLRVDITSGTVTVLRRLLFIPILHRQLDVGDISHLSVKRSGSTGQGVDKIEHFKLQLHDNAGKSLTLAEDLDSKDVATHFCNYLAQRLDVELR
jgi:hypothetical protein